MNSNKSVTNYYYYYYYYYYGVTLQNLSIDYSVLPVQCDWRAAALRPACVLTDVLGVWWQRGDERADGGGDVLGPAAHPRHGTHSRTGHLEPALVTALHTHVQVSSATTDCCDKDTTESSCAPIRWSDHIFFICSHKTLLCIFQISKSGLIRPT